MEKKAWENLQAARSLLEGEDPSPNAAASRAYYAAYQACWCAMNARGIDAPEVRSGVRYFEHEALPFEALEAGVLDERSSQILNDLRDLRIAADYYDDDLEVARVAPMVEKSESVVRGLLEEPEW